MISSSPGGYSLTAVSVEPTRPTDALALGQEPAHVLSVASPSAPPRCSDVPEGERDMEPRTIVGQPKGEGEQLGPDGVRQHHPGAIGNRSPVRMRAIGTLCVVNSIRVSSARRRRATRGVLPSDTSMLSEKDKDETARVLGWV